MDTQWKDVRDFHKAFGHPAPDAPVMLTEDRVTKRARWIDSETQELREATTIADQADAFIDIIYFAIGGLVELGLRPYKLWLIVQCANMAKLWPDGKPRLNEEGRVQKPPTWVDPREDLEAEIHRQICDAPSPTS